MVARAWPERVERVAAFVREAGAEARLEEFPQGTPTAEDAARAVGCELSQIVKSLVFDCDGVPVLVMVPGDRRADRTKVSRAAASARAQIVGAAQVEELTGFAPGEVAPFPLPRIRRVFVDRSLLGHRIVWAGAGSTRHMLGLPPSELVRLARAETVDATAEPS